MTREKILKKTIDDILVILMERIRIDRESVDNMNLKQSTTTMKVEVELATLSPTRRSPDKRAST